MIVNLLFYDKEVDISKYPGIEYITYFPIFYEILYRFLWKGII